MKPYEVSNKLAEEMGGEPASITFNQETREELRVAYNEAVDNGRDSFTLNGREFVTGYAKYLLEYLDMTLGENNVA
jgi:hypothetical protein